MYLVITFNPNSSNVNINVSIFNNKIHILLGLLFFCMIGCKIYESPTSLNEASFSDEKGVLKVTMKNGDELMYDRIVSEQDTYYGLKKEKGKEIRDTLDILEVDNVQRINKRSSSFVNVLGVTVGIGSLYFLYAMFGG